MRRENRGKYMRQEKAICSAYRTYHTHDPPSYPRSNLKPAGTMLPRMRRGRVVGSTGSLLAVPASREGAFVSAHVAVAGHLVTVIIPARRAGLTSAFLLFHAASVALRGAHFILPLLVPLLLEVRLAEALLITEDVAVGAYFFFSSVPIYLLGEGKRNKPVNVDLTIWRSKQVPQALSQPLS